MLSIKKKSLKKVLRGIVVAIIIYITVSMLSTKIIYDYVFRRYSAENPQGVLSKAAAITQTPFVYPCNDHFLTGSLYSDGNGEKGLIVFTPGFRAQSFEYESVISAFLQEGFDVFAFDPTGHGNSEGKSSVGFPQIINDLDATLNFINNHEGFNYNDIFLLGHSWGGYGVCCTMNSHSNITAAVSVNGVDTSMDAIMAYSTKYVGAIAYGNYPFLSIYQNMLFGAELSARSAVEEINETTVPVLIIQAENDEQIPKDKYSVYAQREDITSKNAEFLLYDKEGYNGHVSILYTEDKKPNYEIIRKISDFYTQKSNYKENES